MIYIIGKMRYFGPTGPESRWKVVSDWTGIEGRQGIYQKLEKTDKVARQGGALNEWYEYMTGEKGLGEEPDDTSDSPEAGGIIMDTVKIGD